MVSGLLVDFLAIKRLAVPAAPRDDVQAGFARDLLQCERVPAQVPICDVYDGRATRLRKTADLINRESVIIEPVVRVSGNSTKVDEQVLVHKRDTYALSRDRPEHSHNFIPHLAGLLQKSICCLTPFDACCDKAFLGFAGTRR